MQNVPVFYFGIGTAIKVLKDKENWAILKAIQGCPLFKALMLKQYDVPGKMLFETD